MSENMMNSDHKASNKKSREGWDRIFGERDDIGRNLANGGKDENSDRNDGNSGG
jgi:hypothetical protein